MRKSLSIYSQTTGFKLLCLLLRVEDQGK